MTDPLREMQRLQREMNRVFTGLEQPLSQEVPLVNAWVGEGDVVVTAELPGVDPAKVDISVVGNTLTISGTRDADPLKEGESYHRQERHYGRFSRSLQLPFHVEAGKVEARYERGVLRITLPRAEADKPRKIAVQVQ
ncbi:MAG: Hsp20/alpha crystallin family protein [Deltaproteobacteria bacterium]|jgi:HSP20 family protein|nr:Hsp20/alpha crystallin family protein [Deltaproteobacteria bacterium]